LRLPVPAAADPDAVAVQQALRDAGAGVVADHGNRLAAIADRIAVLVPLDHAGARLQRETRGLPGRTLQRRGMLAAHLRRRAHPGEHVADQIGRFVAGHRPSSPASWGRLRTEIRPASVSSTDTTWVVTRGTSESPSGSS